MAPSPDLSKELNTFSTSRVSTVSKVITEVLVLIAERLLLLLL